MEFYKNEVLLIFVNYLLQEKTEMERQKLDLQKDLSALRDSLDVREEKVRKLQRQLSDAHNENKNVHKQIKEEQEKQQSKIMISIEFCDFDCDVNYKVI